MDKSKSFDVSTVGKEPPTPQPMDKRIVFCMKLWLKELKEDNPDDRAKWIIMTLENEILNGEYCSDEEYNEYLITGVI